VASRGDDAVAHAVAVVGLSALLAGWAWAAEAAAEVGGGGGGGGGEGEGGVSASALHHHHQHHQQQPPGAPTAPEVGGVRGLRLAVLRLQLSAGALGGRTRPARVLDPMCGVGSRPSLGAVSSPATPWSRLLSRYTLEPFALPRLSRPGGFCSAPREGCAPAAGRTSGRWGSSPPLRGAFPLPSPEPNAHSTVQTARTYPLPLPLVLTGHVSSLLPY